MFVIRAGYPLFQRLGLLLLLSQFSLFVFTLPPFQKGLYQVEPLMVAIFTFAIINSVWLVYGLAAKRLDTSSPSPLILCLMVWVLWQVMVTFFARSFWVSWFGAGSIGEGTGRSIALLLMSMIAYPYWQITSCRKIIVWCAIGSVIVQCILFCLPSFNPSTGYLSGIWVTAQYPAYLALVVASLWITLLCGGIISQPVHYIRFILCTLVVLCISYSKSGLVLVSIGIAGSFLAAMLLQSPSISRFFNAKSTNLARWLLALALVAGVAHYTFSYDTVLQKEATLSSLEVTNDLHSNDVLNHIGMETLKHEPARWLFGRGWGHFSDDVYKYMPTGKIHLFKEFPPSMGQPDTNPPPHSANEPLEALLSLGLPGLILWFALPVIALLTLPRELLWRCAPIMVAMVAFDTVWPESPLFLSFNALMLAALFSVCPFPGQLHYVPHIRHMMGILAACGITMLWSVIEQTGAMNYEAAFINPTTNSERYTKYTAEWLDTDMARGGERLSALTRIYALQFNNRDSSENDRGWYRLLLEANHIAALSPLTDATASSTELWLQQNLLLHFLGLNGFDLLSKEVTLALPGAALQLCRKVAMRDDAETIFLLNLPFITHHDRNQQAAILMGMLKEAPGHRPAKWLLGKMLIRQKGRENEGQRMMENAAQRGVDTVYPISDDEIKMALQLHSK